MPVGLFQMLPLMLTTVATVGAFGPTKFPTVELAMPESPVNIPNAIPPSGTTAVKVLSTESTEVTKTVCPFKNDTCPEKLLSTNPSFTEGVLPEYVKVPTPLYRTTVLIVRVAA